MGGVCRLGVIHRDKGLFPKVIHRPAKVIHSRQPQYLDKVPVGRKNEGGGRAGNGLHCLKCVGYPVA